MRSKRRFSHGGELPLAVSRAFSQNKDAADSFLSLSSQHIQDFIDSSFSFHAHANMPAYVDNCVDPDNNMSYMNDQIFY